MAPASPGASVVRLFGRSPKYDELYRLFERAGENVRAGAELLYSLMQDWPEQADRRHDLRELEQAGDRITHSIIHHLNTKSFGPFDREDAFALATRIDDVVDYAEEAADVLSLYNIEAPMEEAIVLSRILRDSGREVSSALTKLPRLSDVSPHLIEIKRLENEGDRVVRDGLGALFSGGVDPLVIIRWKDVYERIEQAIDACEHVAHVLEGISVKQL